MHISAHNISISSISSIIYLYLGFVSQDLQPRTAPGCGGAVGPTTLILPKPPSRAHASTGINLGPERMLGGMVGRFFLRHEKHEKREA